MAEELSQQCLRLSLANEEDDVIELSRKDHSTVDDKMELSIVGKIMTERSVNFEAFKRTMTQIWALSRQVIFRAIENNLFIIQFFHWRDKEKVLDGRPWSFDHQLVMLKEINGDEQPSQVELKLCPFWVRLYDLPFGSRATNDVRMIAGRLGQVLEVEEDVIGWDRARRVRVMLDVHKPLRRFQKIRDNKDNVVKVELKYERLPNYCYVCGMIGHIERDCKLNEEGNGDRQWGPWLRASLSKGRLKTQEEVQELFNGKRALHFQTRPRGSNKEVNEKLNPVSSNSSSTEDRQIGVNMGIMAGNSREVRSSAEPLPKKSRVNVEDMGTVKVQSQHPVGAERTGEMCVGAPTNPNAENKKTPALNDQPGSGICDASDTRPTKKTWKRRQQEAREGNKDVEHSMHLESKGTKRDSNEMGDYPDADVVMEDVRKRVCIVVQSPFVPITDSVAEVGSPRPREKQ